MELVKLYESYLDLYGAITNNLLNLYQKSIQKLEDDYKFGFLVGYSDGYKKGLLETL